MDKQDILERIQMNPRVMTGKPVIRNTRIPIELIVRMVSQGISEEEILREYPSLELADIRAVLEYVAVSEAQPEARLQRRLGGAKESILFIADDFDAPLEDFAEYHDVLPARG